MRTLLTAAALLVIASTAWAGPKTVSLSVPTMDCPVCPITVKQALTKVPGVTQAEVSFDKRRATVTFDDAKTSVEALMRATKNAGYPSRLVESGK
jgi:mercuric ion binding protein